MLRQLELKLWPGWSTFCTGGRLPLGKAAALMQENAPKRKSSPYNIASFLIWVQGLQHKQCVHKRVLKDK
eukprot:316652-Amphidinium_carterae.1